MPTDRARYAALGRGLGLKLTAKLNFELRSNAEQLQLGNFAIPTRKSLRIGTAYWNYENALAWIAIHRLFKGFKTSFENRYDSEAGKYAS